MAFKTTVPPEPQPELLVLFIFTMETNYDVRGMKSKHSTWQKKKTPNLLTYSPGSDGRGSNSTH